MQRKTIYILLLTALLGISAQTSVEETPRKLQIYTFEITENIAPPVWRTTQKAFEEAESLKVDLIIIRMNTYGGMLNIADSLRTKILNSKSRYGFLSTTMQPQQVPSYQLHATVSICEAGEALEQQPWWTRQEK